MQHTHSRRPSALGGAVPIKDGVSVPRGNLGAAKQGVLFHILAVMPTGFIELDFFIYILMYGRRCYKFWFSK